MADTAKALFIVGGLVKQLTTADTLALNSLDAISASGTLAIGGTNTATLNLGSHANTTALTIGGAGLATLDIGTGMGATGVINIGGTAGAASGAQVNINANLRVEGTETVIGDTTFNNPVTFTEEVTFGDVAAPITTITYHSSTRIVSNMTWAETTAGNDYVLSIDASTTGAGNGFQLLGGAGLTDSIGGQIKLVSGAGTGNQAGAGATLVLAGGAAAGANATLAAAGGSTAGGNLALQAGNGSAGIGGNVNVTAGNGSTTGGSITLTTGVGTSGGNGNIVFGHTGGTGDSDFQIFADTNDGTAEAGIRYNAADDVWEIRPDGGTGAWNPIATGYAPSSLGTAYQHLEMNAGKTAMVWVDSLTLPNVPGLSIKPAANSAGSGQKLVVSAGEGNTQPGGDLSLRGGFGKSSTNGSVLIGDSTTSTVVLGVTDTWTFTTSTGMLAPAGTANINLPNNANARFQIEGSPVSDKVTAANLGTLTAGSGSNADALHTHAAGSASFVAYVSPVSGENLNAGAPLGVENNAGTSTVYHADANAAGTRHYCVGLASAAATFPATTSIVTSGERTIPDAIWDTKPEVTDTGKLVYLSETAGKLTYTAPTTAGSVMQIIGIITYADASAGTTRVSVMIGSPVAL